nr:MULTISPECIES: lipoprotein [unclassified Herbaspirillum]
MALCAAVLMLAGCGQKGPLYMPKVPPDPFVRTQPVAPAKDKAAGQEGAVSADTSADTPKR